MGATTVLLFIQLSYPSAYCFCFIYLFPFAVFFKYLLITITNTNTYFVWPGIISWPACPRTHFFTSLLSGIILLYIMSGKSQEVIKNTEIEFLLYISWLFLQYLLLQEIPNCDSIFHRGISSNLIGIRLCLVVRRISILLFCLPTFLFLSVHLLLL